MILMIPRCRLLDHSHNCQRDSFRNEIEWIFIAGCEVYILFILETIVDILSIGLVISDFVIVFIAVCMKAIQKGITPQT